VAESCADGGGELGDGGDFVVGEVEAHVLEIL